MDESNQEQELIEWLDSQETRSVSVETVRKKFPTVEWSVTGVTMTVNDRGERMIPKRDIRDAIKYGDAQD